MGNSGYVGFYDFGYNIKDYKNSSNDDSRNKFRGIAAKGKSKKGTKGRKSK